MPVVQPKDAKMLAFLPLEIPEETVYMTPVPGMRIIINDVIKKV